MALRPDRHLGGGAAGDSTMRRRRGGGKRCHLGSKPSPSFHSQEPSGRSTETVPLETHTSSPIISFHPTGFSSLHNYKSKSSAGRQQNVVFIYQ